ncbi:hypothetical protein D9M71_833900 [compost metagenome]
MQFDEAADHGGVRGLQAGLDAQVGFGGEGGGADQAKEQGAEFCDDWTGAIAGKPAPTVGRGDSVFENDHGLPPT